MDIRLLSLGNPDKQFWINRSSNGERGQAYFMTRIDRATGRKEKTKISRREFETIQLLAMDAAEKVFAARAARLRFVREPGDERFSKVFDHG